jgi:hypothetical protein
MEILTMHEPLSELFNRSQLLILDFKQIPQNIPKSLNIETYFTELLQNGADPRLPVHRQAFNDRALQATGMRYLVSRYAEDRAAMLTTSHIGKQGRTLHLGIDIFSHHLEPVYAPCDGTIVRTGREPGSHSFGHYVVLQPSAPGLPYFFFGHLSSQLPYLKAVKACEKIGQLGDFQENGGWSRHLHLQLFRDLPKNDHDLLGYLTKPAFETDPDRFPDPTPFFPEWRIHR